MCWKDRRHHKRRIGRVQTEAVVIVAILGVIISVIVGMFRDGASATREAAGSAGTLNVRFGSWLCKNGGRIR